MKKKFKKTELGEIPAEWEVVKLGDVAHKIVDGVHKTPKYINYGIPFISTVNLRPFHYDFDYSTYKKFISEEEYVEISKRCYPEKGDILIAKCGTIGRTQLVRVDYKFNIFVGLALLKLNKSLVYGDYLEQLLNSKKYISIMNSVSPGSTRRTLTITELKKIKIPLPPLEEQKAIATVLFTVDKAIEKSEQAIERIERLKKGLMQKLLTKGIGHKKFKKTELGEIPVEWEAVKLGDVVLKIKSGGTPLRGNSKFWKGDIPFIKIEDLTQNGKYLTSFKETISEEGLKHSNAWVVPYDALLLAIYGSLGEVGINKIKGGIVTNQAILGIIPNENLDNEYLYYWLLNFKQRWVMYAKPTTQSNLTLEIVKDSLLPLPPLEEQKKIAEILSAVDERLELEKKRKEKLERIKKGLMSVLLTGKKRLDVEKVKEIAGDDFGRY